MQHKFFLFDFDYTLANSEVGIVKCFELLMEQEHYPIRPYDEIKRTIGMPMTEALSVLLGETDEQLLLELCRKYTVFADKYMTDNTKLYPPVIPMLEKIKANGGRAAIISTKTRRRIMQTLTRDKVTDLIDFVIGVEDVSTYKPSPEGILTAIKRFNGDKKSSVYIGDNIIDAKAAQNAGIDFIAVLTGNNTREEFNKLPHFKIIDNLSQLF